MTDHLMSDQQLAVDQFLTSANGRAKLIMQGDGNLVLYRTDNNRPLWATYTPPSSSRAIMQGDGNFVVYDSGGQPHWDTGTWDHPGAYLVLQDDGNLVIYQNGNPLWASDTVVENWNAPACIFDVW